MTTRPTATELRALVAELKPRSPQEVMGASASSNLMVSMFTAAFTGIGLLLAATFLLFFLGFGPTQQADNAQASETGQASSESETGSEVATAANVASSDPDSKDTATAGGDADDSGNSSENTNSTESAIEAMGIGDTAEPDSKPESLENRLDKILEGLE